jgi:Na+/phosphate symporter
MDATLTLIDLAGSIALLLWGVHMVQSGVTSVRTKPTTDPRSGARQPR